nr:PrgI family protein [uncultured Ruminococcus sp.]
MEIKINKEIRNYFKPILGTETVSWICILAAAPFAALGFLKYNGLTAEKFLWAWIKSEFLTPKKLTYKSTNLYYEMSKSYLDKRKKEVMKNHE